MNGFAFSNSYDVMSLLFSLRFIIDRQCCKHYAPSRLFISRMFYLKIACDNCGNIGNREDPYNFSSVKRTRFDACSFKPKVGFEYYFCNNIQISANNSNNIVRFSEASFQRLYIVAVFICVFQRGKDLWSEQNVELSQIKQN